VLPPAVTAAMPLMRNLNPAARRVLAEDGTVRRIKAGALLWSAGDVPLGLYVVIEGLVRVVRIVAGRQHVVHSEGPGGTLGDVPLFDGSTYPATAIAASAVTCAVFSREALQRAIAADPRLAFVLLARLAGRVRHVIERLDGAQARTVGQRLSRHLVGRFRLAGSAPFDLGGTQTALAEELGTVREVLVRELRALRDAGAIAPVGRGRWRVVDEGRLRHRAGLRGSEGAARET
jgi:CRP/FNR family transcriptional regulator